ncbi:transducer of ERBB2 [Boothiomyces macroporosus]|uniref:Transducer of ERBB2 n=1 Tax=Boothiomyces macroporosus TaxID=261099 RepID=A0AAD5UM25_9FUNG|nr:transducer of ERBB2 [Boothiomyces macroporosus]
MHKEIQIASRFLASFVDESDRQKFEIALQEELVMKFNNHWYPQFPSQGSAFRSISYFHKPDRLLTSVAAYTNTSLTNLPNDLVIWIDPNSVSYKQGQNYVVTLWDNNVQTDRPIHYSPKGKSVTMKHPAQLSPPHRSNSPHVQMRAINVA